MTPHGRSACASVKARARASVLFPAPGEPCSARTSTTNPTLFGDGRAAATVFTCDRTRPAILSDARQKHIAGRCGGGRVAYREQAQARRVKPAPIDGSGLGCGVGFAPAVSPPGEQPFGGEDQDDDRQVSNGHGSTKARASGAYGPRSRPLTCADSAVTKPAENSSRGDAHAAK